MAVLDGALPARMWLVVQAVPVATAVLRAMAVTVVLAVLVASAVALEVRVVAVVRVVAFGVMGVMVARVVPVDPRQRRWTRATVALAVPVAAQVWRAMAVTAVRAVPVRWARWVPVGLQRGRLAWQVPMVVLAAPVVPVVTAELRGREEIGQWDYWFLRLLAFDRAIPILLHSGCDIQSRNGAGFDCI